MTKHPWLAALLSILPGGGHLYIAKHKKALSLFGVFILITLTFFLSGSVLVKSLMLFAYLATVFPAAVESFVVARTSEEANVFSRPYIVFLLLTTGMAAYPVLWESDKFRRVEKLVWTAAVILLAAMFFLFLAGYWAELEKIANERLGWLFNGTPRH